MSVTRKPALSRPDRHPAESIPDREAVVAAPKSEPTAVAGERLTEQHNVRIRPSTKARLLRAVDKLRYESGDRSISIASITDQAVDAYLAERGC